MAGAFTENRLALLSRIPEYGSEQRLLNNTAGIALMVEMLAGTVRLLHLRCDDLQKATKLLSVLLC